MRRGGRGKGCNWCGAQHNSDECYTRSVQRIMACHRFCFYSRLRRCEHAREEREEEQRLPICTVCGKCWNCAREKPSRRKKEEEEEDVESSCPSVPRDVWIALMEQHLDVRAVLALRATCRALCKVVQSYVLTRVLGVRFGMRDVEPERMMATLSAALSDVTVLRGNSDGLLRWRYFSPFDNRNGVYMGENPLQLMRCHDDTFAHFLQMCATTREQLEQLERPMRALAHRFKDGSSVLFDASFKAVMSAILPNEYHHICRRTKVLFEVPLVNVYVHRRTQRASELGVCSHDEMFFHPSGTMIDLVSDGAYVCESLLLCVAPLQSYTCADTLAMYQARFEADAQYCPTVVLYAPVSEHQYWRGAYEGPRSLYGRAAVILDGHHKLHAAVTLKRRVDIVFIDQRTKGHALEDPFQYRGV